MNGVLNFSVLDGWWYEGYVEGAGWALTDKRTYENQQYQDQLDAATIYHCLETEIIPTYYAKNSKGYFSGLDPIYQELYRQDRSGLYDETYVGRL